MQLKNVNRVKVKVNDNINEVTSSLLHNKLQVTHILAKFSLGEDILMDTRYDGEHKHDEADVTIVSIVINRAAAAIAAD